MRSGAGGPQPDGGTWRRLAEGANELPPALPRVTRGNALLEGDEQGGLEDRVGAAEAQAGVTADQVTQQRLIRLKGGRIVMRAAERWRVRE